MCIGIPMLVERSEGMRAVCLHGGCERVIDLSLVGPQPPGTWLLTFLDTAREVIDENTARLILDALRAVGQVLEGETAGIDTLFADLVDREPPLPPHLAARVNDRSG